MVLPTSKTHLPTVTFRAGAMAAQLMAGPSLSANVSRAEQVCVLPAASVTVKVTVCTDPWAVPKGVLGAGLWTTVKLPTGVQLSVAIRAAARFGASPVQSPAVPVSFGFLRAGRRLSVEITRESLQQRYEDLVDTELLHRLRTAQLRVDGLLRESDLVAERRRKASHDAAAKVLDTQNAINLVR